MADLPFLASREDPDEAVRFVWDAFWNLTTDRPVGFATGPIPWGSIDRYAVRHRIDGADAFERFLALIRAMDGAYLDHLEQVRKDKPDHGQP